jgi:hypothetical protein
MTNLYEVTNKMNNNLQTFQDFESCMRNSAVVCIIKTNLTGKAGQRNYAQFMQLYPSPDTFSIYSVFNFMCSKTDVRHTGRNTPRATEYHTILLRHFGKDSSMHSPK